MIATNDPQLADRLRLLRSMAAGGSTSMKCWGFNSRLDELQAWRF